MVDADPAVHLRIGTGEVALFASDVHLHPDEPQTAERFFAQLAAHGEAAAHVFLLGDLFEVWHGDDADVPYGDRLARQLSGLSAAGTRVWLMRGNRDFLMDAPIPGRPASPDGSVATDDAMRYSRRCGATMLPDPFPLDLHGVSTLLAHGDALCTDDIAHQRWRVTSRSATWQQAFLARPVAERRSIGQEVREASEAGKRELAEDLMDVNEDAVASLMARHQARLLIHGHTHRPARHEREGRVRWVLPDWDAKAGRGAMLRAEDGRLAMTIER
jgi:UDP-2,3-diacylglucosamine hydrolase